MCVPTDNCCPSVQNVGTLTAQRIKCLTLISTGFGLVKHLMETESHFLHLEWLSRSGKSSSRLRNTQNPIGDIRGSPGCRS